MSCVCFNCGHHASCQAILGWEIELLFGLREADKPNRFHSVNAALPAALTGPRFLSGRGDEVRDTLIKAKELAAFFDASPSHDESGIRFVGRIEYTSAHDDRGRRQWTASVKRQADLKMKSLPLFGNPSQSRRVFMRKKQIKALRRPFIKELFQNNKFNLAMIVLAAMFGAVAELVIS